MNLDLWPPNRRGLGMCPGLPGFACFLEHFPTVISERNGIRLCFEYETYFGWIPRQGLSQDIFIFRDGMLCLWAVSMPRVMNEAPFSSSCVPFLLSPCGCLLMVAVCLVGLFEQCALFSMPWYLTVTVRGHRGGRAHVPFLLALHPFPSTPIYFSSQDSRLI